MWPTEEEQDEEQEEPLQKEFVCLLHFSVQKECINMFLLFSTVQSTENHEKFEPPVCMPSNLAK